MIDVMKNLLAYIDLDLEEVLNSEYSYQKKIEKTYDKIQKRIDEIVDIVEVEIEKLNPDLEKLERLRVEYQELLFVRYELDKQYLISSETIAFIDLEEIND